jgi:hypothetical protein
MDIAIDLLSENTMLSAGLHLAGYNNEQIQRVCNNTNLDRFRNFYGTSPKAGCKLWEDLHEIQTFFDVLILTTQIKPN